MTSPLEKYENNWKTSMGAWFPGGKAILRGKNILTELNTLRWVEYLVFGITGKVSSRTARILEAMWSISTSYPDPRLWNNRVVALAGTARSTGALALAGGMAVSEATNYGYKPIKGCIDFLFRLDSELGKGKALGDVVNAELKKTRRVFGYGRPIVDVDERIVPLMEFAKSLGVDNRKYIRLAFDVDQYLRNSRYRYSINGVGVAAGLLADEGVETTELYFMGLPCFIAGMVPCFMDVESKQEGALFPLRVEVINYTGTASVRKWNG